VDTALVENYPFNKHLLGLSSTSHRGTVMGGLDWVYLFSQV